MADEFRVRFRGVRGSYPVPGASTVRVGGNTTCLEIWAGGHLIIIDAGTGIIELGDDVVRARATSVVPRDPIVVTLLFTHTHHDHTQGLPFFKPAYLASTVFNVFGPRTFHEDLREVLTRAMIAPVFPVTLEEMPALKRIENLTEGQVILLTPESRKPELHHHLRLTETPPGSVLITPMKSYAHPKGGVVVYRIEFSGRKLVFATDLEGYQGGDIRLATFAKGADLLIHDAQYLPDEYTEPRSPKQGWGHSTPEMAVEVARAAGVKRLALTHHDPDHDDDAMERIDAYGKRLFADSFVAVEGMSIDL